MTTASILACRSVLAAAALVVALGLVTPAQALSPDDLERLSAGKPIVRVMEAEGPIDGQVDAVIDIAAPASAVFSALTECVRAPEVFPTLKSCRVLETDPARAWDVREHKVASWASFLPDLSTVFRSEYQTDSRISFRLISGDLEHLDGEWRLEPIAGGAATRVTYRARVGFHPLVPGFLVRQSLKNDVPKFLDTIRSEALRRAQG